MPAPFRSRVRQGSVAGDPVSVARIVGRFAITGLIALALLSAVTAFASRRAGTDLAIDDAERVTEMSAAGIVAPLLDEGILTQQRDTLERLDGVVRAAVLRGSLVRVKIWSADGTILYSDEPRLIGEQFELGADRLEVFDGGDPASEVSDLSGPENRYETEARLLEVYELTETTTGEPLLFEAYFRYSGVTAVGRQLWSEFAPIAIGALVCLQLVQVPLAWSMARRLRSGQQARERLLRHALEASDTERRRIASDLHDGVVQDLTGVSYRLAAQGKATQLEPAAAAEAAAAIRASVKSLRSLLVEIYPPNLHEEGLESALGDLLGRLAVRGTATKLVVDVSNDDLEPERAAVLYRVAQEALRNVAAHAGAEQVRVTVSRIGADHAQLLVEDDGIGFSAEKASERFAAGHVGLRALTGLVAEFDGVLDVRSEPGSGTRVRVELPMRRPLARPMGRKG